MEGVGIRSVFMDSLILKYEIHGRFLNEGFPAFLAYYSRFRKLWFDRESFDYMIMWKYESNHIILNNSCAGHNVRIMQINDPQIMQITKPFDSHNSQ